MTAVRSTRGVVGGGAALGADSGAGQFAADQVTVGQETASRSLGANNQTTGTGNLRLSFFTARKSETSTQARMVSGSTAAAATPTLVRWGLYSIAANGDGTLVASIANDTTLFAAINTAYTRSWSVAYAMVAGQRYALGLLVVSGAAAPTILGSVSVDSNESAVAPRLTGNISGQADLPASFLAASVAIGSTRAYGVILP